MRFKNMNNPFVVIENVIYLYLSTYMYKGSQLKEKWTRFRYPVPETHYICFLFSKRIQIRTYIKTIVKQKE